MIFFKANTNPNNDGMFSKKRTIGDFSSGFQVPGSGLMEPGSDCPELSSDCPELSSDRIEPASGCSELRFYKMVSGLESVELLSN